MKKSGPKKPVPLRGLSIDEIRLVSDLRVMHSKVEELFQVVDKLKRRHSADDIRRYSDREILESNIDNVDQIYLWFVSLRDK
jgi:hypothetical protein